jgi:excisionase family DNA binding protein
MTIHRQQSVTAFGACVHVSKRLEQTNLAMDTHDASTGCGNSWTSSRVYSLRRVYGIAPYREGERAERGEVTIEEAATALSLSQSTILRMLRDGTLPGQQLCKGAPWIIRLQDLERQERSRRR